MTREQLRARAETSIDRALMHTWVVSQDERDLLAALRLVIGRDDALCDQLLAVMPTRSDFDPPLAPPQEGG